jgi:hypothetical protein
VDQPIVEALMITLSMIMDHEFGDSTTQRRLPYENHPIQPVGGEFDLNRSLRARTG